MSTVLTGATPTHLWQQAVQAAEASACARLNETLESYLVFLLMQFSRDAGLSEGALGGAYLAALGERGALRESQLRMIGDRCLLYAGLFPERAQRKRVSVTYFIDLGQSAYGHLGTLLPGLRGHIYADLAQAFISLTDVLQALRPRTGADLLADLELLQRDSQGARRRLAALWDICQIQQSTDRPQ